MIRTLSLVALLGTVGVAAGTGEPVEVVPALVASGLLLCCSAFFSGTETALFSLQPLDRTSLSGSGRARVDRLLADPRRTLASLLIGNELVNVTLSTVTAGLLLTLFPRQPWLNVVVLTPVLLVLGEVMPKVTALRLNRRWAPLAAPPLAAFSWLVTPLWIVLTAVANGFLRLTGGSVASRKAALREAQLRSLIDQGHRAGSIQSIEQEMLHKVFEFGDLTVARLMTPRPDVFSIGLTTRWDELVTAVRSSGYSRVPVFRSSHDDIIGILLVKKLLPLLRATREAGAAPPAPQQIRRLLHPVRFVPTTKRAEDMLAEFRKERLHMAIVVDEHGSVVGVVTLDDLLRELVGELLDETDQDEPDVTPVTAGTWTVRASMDVDDFGERFETELPRGEYNTVGGFVMTRLGEVPEKGTELVWNGLLFRVSGVEGHRVTELCVCERVHSCDPAEAR